MTSLRSRLVAATAALFVAVLAIASPVSAQPPPPLPIEVLATQSLDTGLVQIAVSLPPEVGTRDVPASAFVVLQGAAARPVTVTRLPSEDLDIVLAFDVSGSMTGAPIDAARAAALTFVREIPADARVGVVAFGDLATSLAPLGTDIDTLASVISSLTASGETALFDGVSAASALLAEGAATDSRRTIVVLSDGDDTVSTVDLAAAIESARDVDGRVFAVALRGSDYDPDALAEIAGATGGRLVLADDLDVLAQLYSGIASTLSNEYIISFEPLPSGPTDVTVAVTHLGVTAAATASFTPPTPLAAAPPATAVAPTVRDATAATLSPQVGSAPPFVQTTAGRALGLGLVAGALGIVGYLLAAPARSRTLLARAGDIRHRVDRPSVEGLRAGAERVAERALQRGGRGLLVADALERAGLAVRPAEFVVLAAIAGLGAAALGYLFGGVLMAILLFTSVLVGARVLVARKVVRRRERFADQLPGTLQLMSGTLRTGYALPQVIETISRESDSPTRDEFHRVMTESRLGRDVGASLRAAADRMRCDDFDWVVRAIEIHREVGGDLAEVLGNVAATIRDRNSLRRTVQALSADGRMSAWVIIALPIAALVLLTAVNPEYVDVFYDEPLGRALLGLAILMITAGGLWVKRLVRLEY